MSVRLMVCIVCLLGIPGAERSGAAGNDIDSTNQTVKQSKAAQYRDRAKRRMEYNKCYRAGLPECYKQFQEAVDWCNKNWERCFPLIDGAGTHAANFGGQILRECRKKLKQGCREKSGF